METSLIDENLCLADEFSLMEISDSDPKENKFPKNIQDVHKLAKFLHAALCNNKWDCSWTQEDWLSLEIHHHRAEFYDKAEKIYNYFDQNEYFANKFIQLLISQPETAKLFFDKLM